MADLYVHTSDAEIEAMSCMEAFACGLVPVIADSPRSATPQFALDERSLFPAGDADALAERIDWWIEHPQEREEMEHRYADHASSMHSRSPSGRRRRCSGRPLKSKRNRNKRSRQEPPG